MSVVDQLCAEICSYNGNALDWKIKETLANRRANTALKVISSLYPEYKEHFDKIVGDLNYIGAVETYPNFVYNFYINNLTRCPICNGVMIKGMQTCSRECLAKMPQERQRRGNVALTKQEEFMPADSIKRALCKHFENIGVKYSQYQNEFFIESINLLIKIDTVKDSAFSSTKDANANVQFTTDAESVGLTVFHIFETDPFHVWVSMIDNKLRRNYRIFARKCEVREVPNDIALDFLNRNHLQGKSNSSIRLGLYYNDKLVSCMTFSKARFTKKYEWELVRFCSLRGLTVVGAASKLFKAFVQKHHPKSITSYANRRFSQGDLYQKLGFTLVQTSKPNYSYFKNNKTYSRVHFQKHRLVSLPEYRADLSEIEIMDAAGYERLYDCGNYVFGMSFS